MSDLRTLADAVMYEGYLLWPYRRTALKNQRRWTFGCVFPPAWTALHPDDAAPLGLTAGESVLLRTNRGEVQVRLHLSARMAPGLVVLPRLRGTPLEPFVPGTGLQGCTVEKGGAP